MYFGRSGILAVTLGWESVFYVFGCIGLIWFFLWIFIVKRSPQDDPYITDEERTYIIASLGNQKTNLPKFIDAPWKSIWTSSAVWAIIVAHFCESWGFFTLLTELPSFLKGYRSKELRAYNQPIIVIICRHTEL